MKCNDLCLSLGSLFLFSQQCVALGLNALLSSLASGLGLSTLSVHLFLQDSLASLLCLGLVDLRNCQVDV